MVQLEQLKRMGPMEPAEAKPVPCGEQSMDFIFQSTKYFLTVMAVF
jgi:hypothetical protein